MGMWERPPSGQGRGTPPWPPGPPGTPQGPAGTPPGAPVPALDDPYGPDPHGRTGLVRARRRRRRALLTVAGIFAASLLVQGGLYLVAANDPEQRAADTDRTVRLPAALDLDGSGVGGPVRLPLADDFGDDPGIRLDVGESDESAARRLTPVAGRYREEEPQQRGRPAELVVRGYNGYMRDPETFRNALLSAALGEEVLPEERERLTPTAAEEPLTCALVYQLRRDTGRPSGPVPGCAWANRGSVGVVVDHSGTTTDTSRLAAFAERAAQVREQVRTAAGTEAAP